MNEVTIKGEIKFVDEVREYGNNGFRKHQVVVETGDGKWDNPVPVEFIKDAIEKSQGLQVGDKVSIDARINKIQKEGGQDNIQGEPDSSSFDTYDEYDDGIEEEVF